jgi:phosphoserine phosphatase
MSPAQVNLVVQGAGATAADAAQLAAISGAKAIEQLGEAAWRLREARPTDEVAGYCEARLLDHAWVPAGRRFAGLGLLAMDMDSTLITIECIDEIGGMLGIKAEIAAITERAMRGEIDYPESLRCRVALLAGLGVEALDRVYTEKLRLSPGAERLVQRAQGLGIRTLLVSGGFTFFTERLKERLSLDHTLSNVLEIEGGKLTGRVTGAIVDAAAKAARVSELTHALGLRKDQVLAIGDGANDLAMMAVAGVSVAYRAKPVVRAQATHALSHSGLDAVLNLFE